MSRSRNWCFTLNNYTEDDFSGLSPLHSSATYLVAGKEVGDSGTPHLQGFITFRNARKLSGVTQAFFAGRGHWEIALAPRAAAEYCKKEGDYLELGDPPSSKSPGSRSDLSDFQEAVKGGLVNFKRLREAFPGVCAKYPRYVTDYVRDNSIRTPPPDHPLRQWQSDVSALLSEVPDRRTILFVVDVRGNGGKSWFSDHYEYNHPEFTQVLNPGKKADMAFALSCTTTVLFVDAPRSKQGEYIQYDFLEDVKNGRVFSGKYESGMKYLEPCHVVVMMNEEPDLTKLSDDRFKIIYVDSENGASSPNFNN